MKAVKTKPKFIMAAIIVVILLLLAFFAAYWKWDNNYRGRIDPGTSLGELDLSGLTREDAESAITEQTDKIISAGIIFSHGGQKAVLSLDVVSLDATPILLFDNQEMAGAVLENNGSGKFVKYLWRRAMNPGHKNLTASYELNTDKIKSFLNESFPDLNISAENAYFSWSAESGGSNLKIISEKIGKEMNYDQILINLNESLQGLAVPQIIITTKSTYPTVTEEKLKPLREEAEKIVARDGIVLRVADLKNPELQKYLTITPEKLITWVTADTSGDSVTLSLDQNKIKEYLAKTIAPKIDQEAIQPRFEVANGKVSNWQTGQSGQKINLEASAQKITEGFATGQSQIDLVVEEVTSETMMGDNNFQIKEILGTGHSNFKGSSSSRQKNIRVGAAALHGLLIKPGEEFSLIATLGDVSAATGYLPELVIKGDKTVPEYGGGLCQIGTTVFRTALATGLPITMRQNHSYRVSYYEPAGTDATIYIPWPDFRFINDTGNYILIQARITGNDVYFDFWGVKDGRTATTTYPVIYNIVKPEPTKIVETDSLKPGEKKCTESSHNGADAYFDYTVVYPEGATTTPVQEKRFKSHYVPWRAVCLVGKTASSTATTTPATSTTPVTTSTPVSASSTISN